MIEFYGTLSEQCQKVINNAFVCQKDLFKQGTLEEFENLFEGKIVRKN